MAAPADVVSSPTNTAAVLLLRSTTSLGNFIGAFCGGCTRGTKWVELSRPGTSPHSPGRHWVNQKAIDCGATHINSIPHRRFAISPTQP